MILCQIQEQSSHTVRAVDLELDWMLAMVSKELKSHHIMILYWLNYLHAFSYKQAEEKWNVHYEKCVYVELKPTFRFNQRDAK